MTVCPKCGSDKIIGPKFVSGYGQEALRYECFRCGYVTHGPTVEQRKNRTARTEPPNQ